MPPRFVNLDRQTPLFLPCDLREWLPAAPLVHFILDAVEQIPTGHFRVNHRGTGSEQYPPTLMRALLIYCYATGRFGSRTIEAATHSDVAVRYLCANHHPDHDSICVFRTANRAAFQAAFVTVLPLARQLRLTRAAGGGRATQSEEGAPLADGCGQVAIQTAQANGRARVGIIKSVLGFRQFLLRGREKVSLEWLLVCVSYNFKRLFTLKNLTPAG